MLERLRARTVVGGDHQHRGVDLARPDEHVADQPVVPGDVDEVELDPVVEREMGVADVDGHPAALLLGQPVGVDAGQRAQQRGLAVVDVAGRADDDGHARPARAWAIAPPSASSASGSTVRRSSTTRSSSMRPMTAGLASTERGEQPVRRARLERDPERGERLAGQRAATDRRAEVDDRRARDRAVAASASARARSVVGRGRDHPPDGDGLDRAARAVQPQRQRRRRRAWPCPAASPGRAGRVASGRPGRPARPPARPAARRRACRR